MRKPERIERLYLDFDSFFASAEQHFDARLTGRPVGVVPVDSPATCLIAASREAKKFGFKVGTPVREARRVCPDIIIRVARPDAYVRLHHAIREAVETVLPIHAVRSIDEVYCILMENEAARGVSLAQAIKQELRSRFGPALTASIGLAPNELLAKIAAEMNKPDGLVVLHPDSLPGPLLDLELRDVPGISRGMEARLLQAGVETMQALWDLAPKHARRIWRSVEGERFWALLHGYALEKPVPAKRMFGHGRVLAWNWRTPDKMRDCARILLMKAARRMRREGFLARALFLGLRGENGQRWQGGTDFPALRDDRTLLQLLDQLLVRGWRETGGWRVKTLQVALHDLVAGHEAVPDLFPMTSSSGDRWNRIADLGDRLNRRYGASALSLGPRCNVPGGYAGAKIAFGRIPDLADF